MRRPEQMLRLIAVAILAPSVVACSSDISSVNILPKIGAIESLSLGNAQPTRELRPVTAADLVDPQGQCASRPTTAAQGGIALEMTECEVVGRAGPPENVQLGTTDRGERSLTLTYTGGPRPGIYRFAGGRLYAIERGEEPPPEPAKPKKPAPKKPKSA
ncbi:MAG TPA: hypothetical protein VG145_02070 [Xanthobacteraceae bacterium]|nr:hypothetical protein [Xanthobacteraceae bacterium]